MCLFALPSSQAADWPPITADELRMTSEPKAPKAAAIILYRQVDRNDESSFVDIYQRIKVLTEEGRRYGNVEIPYDKRGESIRAIEARTIRPDGTTIDFDGTVHDKPLLVSRIRRYSAKTFSLPSVEVGSILEVRYRHSLQYGAVFDSRWILSDELFIKRQKFSLRPSPWYALTWSWPLGLPVGSDPPTRDGALIRLDAHDVPPFVVEEHMPPADLMKFRVEFEYDVVPRSLKDADKYWQAFGKYNYRRVENFLYGDRDLARTAARVAPESDPPEIRLRELYAYAQSLRNRSFERPISAEEARRANIKDIENTSDILEQGYAHSRQITWLYLGLVRGAGFKADAVLVPTRDRHFFDPKMLNASELNSNAVVVDLDGHDVYLDPGVPCLAFGLLPWTKTAVTALRLDGKGGQWVTTPNSKPGDSRIERKADLHFDPSGSLQGRVKVTYTGHEATERRLAERDEDDAGRREFLENDLKRDVPVGVEVELVNAPDWSGSDTPLVAEFELKVTGWATSAGRRVLIPVGLFSGSERHMFEHAVRVQPLYFEYPYEHVDEVVIRLPAGWRIGSTPTPYVADIDLARYRQTVEDAGGSLRLRRELTMNMTLIAPKFYGTVRDFYQSVRAGDAGQIVVERAQPSNP